MYQLLIWLLIETEEYNRAYHVARQFENSTPYDIYSLFTLGHQLRSAHQFEIAVQSYEYYLETPTSSLQPRALEELGDRKITRLNSSHVAISYAVFCLKKKITQQQ